MKFSIYARKLNHLFLHKRGKDSNLYFKTKITNKFTRLDSCHFWSPVLAHFYLKCSFTKTLVIVKTEFSLDNPHNQ